jgi:aspartyl-tRNA(Asn)/glutamyl-tRNA(Gln) amidotransferase subunit C
MLIDKETVRGVAALARLRIEPEEEERWLRELEAILEYMEQLRGLDVEGIEPTSQVGAGTPAPLRPDEERPADVREEALGQAPDRDGDFFRVPRVV